MNALTKVALRWSDAELDLLHQAIRDELLHRMDTRREPPPVSGKEMIGLMDRSSLFGDAAKRLRHCRFEGKPNLRVVSPDERPRELQWNAALESWG